MSGHWNIFIISQFFCISYFGMQLQSVGCNYFFFHCNLTSQLVQNFLLHTLSSSISRIFIFFLLFFLSLCLIFWWPLSALITNLTFFSSIFHFPLPHLTWEQLVYICSLSNSFSASTYAQTQHQQFPRITDLVFFSSFGPKCHKFREVQLLICGLGTSIQFLP